jgi:hypothetical protein
VKSTLVGDGGKALTYSDWLSLAHGLTRAITIESVNHKSLIVYEGGIPSNPGTLSAQWHSAIVQSITFVERKNSIRFGCSCVPSTPFHELWHVGHRWNYWDGQNGSGQEQQQRTLSQSDPQPESPAQIQNNDW